MKKDGNRGGDRSIRGKCWNKRVGNWKSECHQLLAEALRQQLAMTMPTHQNHTIHPDTLRSRHKLAIALNCQGKYAQAEALYRETMELRTKVLGAEHPETPKSKCNLAVALRRRGKSIPISSRTSLGAKHGHHGRLPSSYNNRCRSASLPMSVLVTLFVRCC